MTTIDMAYEELLREELPHTIHSERDYSKYLARAEKLLDKPKRSAAESRYLELLSVLIERFEEDCAPVGQPEPLEALKELMAANGMSQAKLAQLLGSSGIASEILSSKRSLSKTHIRKLADIFNVSTDLFI